MPYTEAQLEKYMKDAYSYENRKGHGKEELETTFVGSVRKGVRIYDLYADTEGNYWYKVRVITDGGIVSEKEAVFGHSERKEQTA